MNIVFEQKAEGEDDQGVFRFRREADVVLVEYYASAAAPAPHHVATIPEREFAAMSGILFRT